MATQQIANLSYGNVVRVRVPILALIIKESEGVLMIIIYDVLFGCINIVFQLTFFEIIFSKSSETVYEESKDMLAFPYLAIPTRHEVT